MEAELLMTMTGLSYITSCLWKLFPCWPYLRFKTALCCTGIVMGMNFLARLLACTSFPYDRFYAWIRFQKEVTWKCFRFRYFQRVFRASEEPRD